MSGAFLPLLLAPVAVSITPALDRITPLDGGEVVVRGELRSALDGSTFDAVTEDDRYPSLRAGERVVRLGGLFDLVGGGLRVIEQDPAAHVYRLGSAGRGGMSCLAAGVPPPCLVPRLDELAHERLVTADELRATLGGRLEALVSPPPAPPLVGAEERSAIGWIAAVAGLLGLGTLARALRRARRGSAIGQVRAAAAEARRALRGEPTLAAVRDQVAALVARAVELERARRACARRLGKLDRARLEARHAAWTQSSSPDALAALAALAAERAEADQLGADLAATVAGLERIASSLRALGLRCRAERGARAVVAGGADPVEAMLGELAVREAAGDEADRVLADAKPHLPA
jgi:hypothetical protein